jgi:hypothetical protein
MYNEFLEYNQLQTLWGTHVRILDETLQPLRRFSTLLRIVSVSYVAVETKGKFQLQDQRTDPWLEYDSFQNSTNDVIRNELKSKHEMFSPATVVTRLCQT